MDQIPLIESFLGLSRTHCPSCSQLILVLSSVLPPALSLSLYIPSDVFDWLTTGFDQQ